MAKRDGGRKSREQLSRRRTPELGYYIIVTNAKETEQNYFYGLRDSIPKELQGKLVIKVCRSKTAVMVDEALRIASLHPQYGEPWIIFDRDRVMDFDRIIELAQEKGVHVGWSNPCIEVWFHTYFGTMPAFADSVSCCSGFRDTYCRVCGQDYSKTDDDVYRKLCRFGDEEQAIRIAKQKNLEHQRNRITSPSEMCPATTVHILVEKIMKSITGKSD